MRLFSAVAPLATVLLAAAPAAGQGSFTSFGQGCASSGWSYGADVVLPASQANAFAGSNNNIPFSWTPTRYQQPFVGSEMGPGPHIYAGMGLRQISFINRDAHLVELEIFVGGTSYDPSTITATFDTNFDVASAPKTSVFARRPFALPRMPATANTNPAEFFLTIPFDAPTPILLGPGENLLIEVVNWGNTNNNALFTYPLDAGSGLNTTRIYASGNPTAASGTVGRNYGHVIALKPIGGVVLPRPDLYHSNLPVRGQAFRFGLLGAASGAPTVLFVGSSDSNWMGLPLPFDLTPLGAPGCSVLVSGTVLLPMAARAGGDVAAELAIPADAALLNATVFLQFLTVDARANALGIALSQGGRAVIG